MNEGALPSQSPYGANESGCITTQSLYWAYKI